jgi:hypothetical protein
MAKLCKAGVQLREQIDDAFPDRDRMAPEGWLGDSRHAARRSDHNPDPDSGVVRAYDFNHNLSPNSAEAHDFANQLRLLARVDKRISYIIYDGRIASWIGNYKWRKYRGINPHRTHIHVSFTKKGDHDSSMFRMPMLTGEPINGRTTKNRRKLGQVISGRSSSDLRNGGLGCQCDCQCRNRGSNSGGNTLPK